MRALVIGVLALLGSGEAAPAGDAPGVDKLCGELTRMVGRLGWKIDPCVGVEWKVGGRSVRGRPLIYAEFGSPSSTNTTLIFSAVHGDENTPLYLGLQLVRWVMEHQSEIGDMRIVVAPLVNPDGIFHVPRTRVNARGVDVNRNFPTQDWQKYALSNWRRKFRSDPRRFPGREAGSEPETVFQQDLIRKVKPQKILAIHAPLNFMDYDGPSVLSLDKFPRQYISECLKLRSRLKAVSGGFYPGSLGNYAGQEMGIPTLTLELPSADPRKADQYWKKFQTGIRTMIEFKVSDVAAQLLREGRSQRPLGFQM